MQHILFISKLIILINLFFLNYHLDGKSNVVCFHVGIFVYLFSQFVRYKKFSVLSDYSIMKVTLCYEIDSARLGWIVLCHEIGGARLDRIALCYEIDSARLGWIVLCHEIGAARLDRIALCH